MKITRLGQKQLMPALEAALGGGLPLVIENLGLTYDAVLAPVVGRQVMRRGRSTFVKLGDKEVDYDPGFKLYLQTKLSNPHCAFAGAQPAPRCAARTEGGAH